MSLTANTKPASRKSLGDLFEHLCCLVHILDIPLLLLHELVKDVDGHGEDDGGVVLS